MIIKKNKLDKITGNVEPAEQEESLQEESFASYTQEQYESEATEPEEYPENNYSEDEAGFNKETAEEQTENLNIETEEEEKETESNQLPVESQQPQTTTQTSDPDEINLFDLDNIDFNQRQERRRGDRRRGFRRVDDRNLVSRAREEADAIRESAQKEGYEAGLLQAQDDINELKESLAQFINTKQEVFDAIAPELLNISVEIAQKIIKKEIEQGPEVLINTVVDVLKTSLSKEETKVTLRVNPAEVNEVKQAVPEILNLAGIDTKIVVLSDEEVSEGGCQITTTNGIVDATLESRMRVVMQTLREI